MFNSFKSSINYQIFKSSINSQILTVSNFIFLTLTDTVFLLSGHALIVLYFQLCLLSRFVNVFVDALVHVHIWIAGKKWTIKA